MERPDDEFWHSSPIKIFTAIDMYADEMQVRAAVVNKEEYNSKYFGPTNRQEVRDIKSMHEIEGW
jgi:hypothetical protein